MVTETTEVSVLLTEAGRPARISRDGGGIGSHDLWSLSR